jgi:glycosyltransferase involved in cell wall biosynthesis
MFGWEFPPHMSGGLGTACQGITKGLAKHGAEIVFVIPKMKVKKSRSHVRLLDCEEIVLKEYGEEISETRSLRMKTVNSPLSPYMRDKEYIEMLKKGIIKQEVESSIVSCLSGEYGPNLFSEVYRYAQVAGMIALQEEFDVIHAHDWMTFPAGIEARRAIKKPLIVHIHALEFDRSGIHINQDIYEIERTGLDAADHIITVSHYTKNRITEFYGISPSKISVVHNAVSRHESQAKYQIKKDPAKKYVLFLGRVTFQKGPDYFIEAANLVLSKEKKAHFIMAGSGDMLPRMIERAAELKIGSNFYFTGFLKGDEVEKAFAMSDVYVMPSVSEPFGISALEAMAYDVPVIISKQSGVSELLKAAIKVDFWDVKELANKILGVLKYQTLHNEMAHNGKDELKNIRWENAGKKIMDIYHSVV